MGKVLFASVNGVHVLRLEGEVRVTLGPTLYDYLGRMRDQKLAAVVVDLSAVTTIDSTSLGLLAKIALRCQELIHANPTMITTREDITRVVVTMGLEQLFVVVDRDLSGIDSILELPPKIVSERVLREQVLEAHRVLMSLSPENDACFRDLVQALEAEQTGGDHGNTPKAAAT